MEVNKILNGDCLQHLKELPDNSVDAIITDPPYGLSFMNKKWDYDIPLVDVWKECLRVLKQGGHLLSFAGTRTYHRMAVNIEDAGFEIRDCIMWLYGSGFPKSLNIGKQIDKIQGNKREVIGISNEGVGKISKSGIYELNNEDSKMLKEFELTKGNSEWEGWGTALKPACEPIVMARKPLGEKSIALNVLKHNTGGLNIDACRIGHNEELKTTSRMGRKDALVMNNESCGFDNTKNVMASADPKGRFPANIILDEEAGKMLDEQSGITKSSDAIRNNNQTMQIYGKYNPCKGKGYKDSGGASRFFYVVKANKKERDLGCDALQEKPMRYEDNSSKSLEIFSNQYTDSSGNPTGRGKTTPKRNNHPTVKPIKLMEYLVKLITREGQIILDPFLGSGTTAIACVNLKRNWIGIERESEYIEIAQARINHFSKQTKLRGDN